MHVHSFNFTKENNVIENLPKNTLFYITLYSIRHWKNKF